MYCKFIYFQETLSKRTPLCYCGYIKYGITRGSIPSKKIYVYIIILKLISLTSNHLREIPCLLYDTDLRCHIQRADLSYSISRKTYESALSHFNQHDHADLYIKIYRSFHEYLPYCVKVFCSMMLSWSLSPVCT